MSHSTFTMWSLHGIWVLQTSIWSLWAPVGLVSGISCARMRTRDFCTDGSSPPLDCDLNLNLRIWSKGEIGCGGWEACLGKVLRTTNRGPHWPLGSPWCADWCISGPNGLWHMPLYPANAVPCLWGIQRRAMWRAPTPLNNRAPLDLMSDALLSTRRYVHCVLLM